MHITGIVDTENSQEVLDTIKYFMSTAGVKISVTDYGSRFKNKDIWNDYCSALVHIGTEILLIKIKAIYLDEVIRILPIGTIIVNDISQWKKISTQIKHENNIKQRDMIIILNSDIIKPSNFTDEEKYRVLCYGFNSDSNITASSTGEPYNSGQFLCCVKNSIVSTNGSCVEPQEFAMNLDNIKNDPYNLLAAASFAVLHGIDLNRINKINKINKINEINEKIMPKQPEITGLNVLENN